MPDADRSKGAPVDLGLLRHQSIQPAIERRTERRPQQAHGPSQLHDGAGIPAGPHHLKEPGRAQAGILRERLAHEGQVRIELRRPTRAAPHRLPIGDRGPDRLMVDAEVGGDGADLPVFAVVEAANLGVLFGGDHRTPLRTRDGSASAVERATRFRGRRPGIATRPPEARSAIDPSTCQRAVWRGAWGRGKPDPSRARDTRAGDRDDRAVLPGCADGAVAPPGSRSPARRSDSRTSNRHGRDRTPRRSRRGGGSAGRSSGEAACPRRRSSGGSLRLDVQSKPWHNRRDGLGASEPEAVTRARRFSPGPHPQSTQPTRSAVHKTNAEAVDGAAPVDAQNAPTSRLENHRAGFPHRPPPLPFR